MLKKIQTKKIALFTYAPFKVEWIFESKETFCIHWFQAFLFSFFYFFIFHLEWGKSVHPDIGELRGLEFLQACWDSCYRMYRSSEELISSHWITKSQDCKLKNMLTSSVSQRASDQDYRLKEWMWQIKIKKKRQTERGFHLYFFLCSETLADPHWQQYVDDLRSSEHLA